MAYKIGDKVIKRSIGDVFLVIATKESSHKLKGENGELTGEILEVPTGYDYVVVSENELKSEKKFSPYYNVVEKELTKYN